MPRQARVAVGNTVYHVINRANARQTIFHNDTDYRHFESLLLETKELIDMRILGYCIMPNHWHLILYPKKDADLSECMRLLTTTHARQYRTRTESIGYGHLYQGRYKSFPVASDRYLLTLIRYVEQNPLRARLVKKAQDWQWGSLWRREKGSAQQKKLLASLPTVLPKDYLDSVNTIFSDDDLEKMRYSVNRGAPYGPDAWVASMVDTFKLGHTLRGSGRPKKR